MDNKFWKDKTVLITGYEGFLGSHLTKSLLKTKARLVGIDIRTYRSDTILEQKDYQKLIVYKGSVTDFNLLQKILKKHSIDVIFHLAAEAIVGKSYNNPRNAFTTNIKGTWEVLEAARLKGDIKAIVVASSDKAYGEHKRLPYREDTPFLAKHPYDVSKACADLIAASYAKSYGLPVCVTRCGNIYGPGDFNFSRIIPDCICCLLSNRPFLIRSNGKFIRDYIFVGDIVEAYLLLVEQMIKLNIRGETFNFSNETPISVLDLVAKIYKLAKQKGKFLVLNNASFEIEKQYLSSVKAKRILGWKPKMSFEKGLKLTIQWYKRMIESNENSIFRY